ncbi:hypothetical protein PsorP6_008305 [Peronosclerospora sorghi]|uniref:Uncharacterized protein n=1 Tax=Peronosclerospora sorghi TaxID=230839 RepID=A0ACC0W8T6_9STRA|nr:hypothetical protein PsorP6_008305 [Peronosclerospora sorghi]
MGKAFSDVYQVTLRQTLNSVTLSADERLDAIMTNVASPVEATWNHGGSGGQESVLLLESGEFINMMEISWGETQEECIGIFFLNLTTNMGNSVSFGTKTEESTTVTAPDGFELSGFYGRAAAEVHQLGIIWTRRSAQPAKLNDRMATGWYGKRIRNWVGPNIGYAADSACYRMTESFDRNATCPANFKKRNGLCLAQCPLAYPVEMTLEMAQKGVAIITPIVNVSTVSIFSDIFLFYHKARKEFLCAANVVGVIRSLLYYLRFQQITPPQSDVERVLAVAYQSDVVVVDLPVAITNFLGLPVPSKLVFIGIVLMIVEAIVKTVIRYGDSILSTAQNVYRLLHNVTTINGTSDSVDELQGFLDKNSTCGYQLKSVIDRIILSVNRMREINPDMTIADLRVTISKSSLVLKDIPTATNNCMNEFLSYKTESAAFKTRDLLRKTMGVIVDQLVYSGKTDLGSQVGKEQNILETTNMGLTMLAGLNPTQITWLASQYIQPTCGPTAFIGEIDDGSLDDALGLTTVGEAFVGSYGTWSKKGDGLANLFFTSIDTENVTVVLYSGGEEVTRLFVAAGETMTWNGSITDLHDKVLYLDRWRPNRIGFLGTGGGSLKLWVPRASKGGHLRMQV